MGSSLSAVWVLPKAESFPQGRYHHSSQLPSAYSKVMDHPLSLALLLIFSQQETPGTELSIIYTVTMAIIGYSAKDIGAGLATSFKPGIMLSSSLGYVMPFLTYTAICPCLSNPERERKTELKEKCLMVKCSFVFSPSNINWSLLYSLPKDARYTM